MKKQINPTIKAHLIRSAFYVVLLLAVCVIPFALAQRNTIKRGFATKSASTTVASIGAVPSTGAAPLLDKETRSKAKQAAAAAKKNIGAPGSLAGASQLQQGKSGAVNRQLPHQVRSVPPNVPKFPYSSIRDPNAPITKGPARNKVSGPPTKSGSSVSVRPMRILPHPQLPRVTLYDQYDNAGALSTGSQNFEAAFDAFDDFTGDDFVVPGGETWNITEVDVLGTYFNGPGPAVSFNVFIYQDSGGFPGTAVYTGMNQPYTTADNLNFVMNLIVPAVLPAGTYWISIQCNMDFGVGGQWGWTDRLVQGGANGAVWQNPGGGFGSPCITWGRRGDPLSCNIDPGVPDQVYRLVGTTGGGACASYNFTQGEDIITPGDTDTGNHTDDGDTFVALPFTFQLYDQTYNGVNVNSNGRLDFVCINEPVGYQSACLPPPDNQCPYDYTIFPMWTDMRTDIGLSGCSAFPGGTCGIFTSVSGSAPNRIFNIEWRTVYFNDNNATANFEVRLYENDPNKRFDVIFGGVNVGSDQLYVSGVEQNNTTFTQALCDANPPTTGEADVYTCGAGPTPSPTPSPTCTPGTGGLLVGSGMTTGFLPNGWEPTLASNTVNYTFANSLPAPNEFALFDTHDPWGFTVVKDAITANGHTFAEFTPAQLAGFNFADYSVIILNWDDTVASDFNADYTAAIPALEAYINAGGVVWVTAAIQSCDSIPMPFGGQGNGCDFGNNDPVVDPANPMMAGMPNPIPGSAASHLSFSGLPGLAHIVVTSDASGQPALYELFPGGGGCNPTPSPTATPSCTPGGNEWSEVASLPFASRGPFVVSDGTFYYLGGGYDGTNVHNDLLRYDPVANTYTPLTSAPDQFFLSQAVIDNGKIYSIAGFNLGGQSNTTRIYDIAGDSWTTGAALPEPNGLSDAATGLINGKIYIACGFNGSGASNTLHIYDIATDSWTTGANALTALYLPGFGAVNGKFYVISGNNGGGEVADVQIYDPATDSWSNGAPIPTPVTGPASAVFNGKIYVFGGAAPFPVTTTMTQIYDPATDSWSTGPNMVVARLWFYGGALDPISILGPGGDNSPGIPISDDEIFAGGGCGSPTPTPSATPTCPPGSPNGGPGPWTAGNPYPSTIVRYGFAQTATNFYVFGGVDNGSRVNNVNTMDLGTGTWSSLAPMPFTSEAPTCALDASSGIVYCAEGDTGNNFASYNIASNTWTPLANTPNTDDYGAASGAFNGKVFLVGGTTGFITSVWVYDIATNTWSSGNAIPGVSSMLLPGYTQVGQFLYVVGGFDNTFVNNATTLRLDMSTGNWDTGPTFTPQLGDFGLAYDAGTNKLYSLGGDLPNDGNPFNSTNQVNELDLSGWPGGTWNPSPPDLPLPNRQAAQAGFYGNGDIWCVGGIDGATFQFLNEVWHRSNGGGVVCPSPTPTPSPASPTPTPTPVTPTPTPITPTPTPTPTVTITPPPLSPTPTPSATRPPPTPRPRPTPFPRPTP